MSRGPYAISPRHDPDLVGLDGEQLRAALDTACTCGHARSDHFGATGALASFGGTACEHCWTCPTYQPTTHPNHPGEPHA